MKVAIITHDFPPESFGGIGTHSYMMADGLHKHGIDVSVFCPKIKGKNKELKTEFRVIRLNTINLPPHALWFQFLNYKFFKNKLNSYDIIVTQMTSFSLFYYLKNKIKKPWNVVFHSNPLRDLKIFLKQRLNEWSLGDFLFNVLEFPLYHLLNNIEINNSDCNIIVSETLYKEMQKEFKIKNFVIINNGIDYKRIMSIERTVKSSDSSDKNVVLFIGRLYYTKGITYLIEAMSKVIKKNKNVELRICGIGPLDKKIKNLVEKLNIKDNIKFLGFIPHDEIIREIKTSKVVVLPSLAESFSFVFLEIMAVGKPLVAFDYPFAREIIRDNYNGKLSKPLDTNVLALNISFLISNKKLREYIGKNARKLVIKKYTSDKVIKNYIKLFKKQQQNEI